MNRGFTFSLIHTTARLRDGWKSAHDLWLDSSANPADVEYVVTVDQADEDKWPGFPESAQRWGQIAFAVNEKRPCPVDGWNKAAEVSTGQFLITVSDDIRPYPNWDDAIRLVVPDMSKEVVLDVNYGPKAFPGFLFFNFMTRARYERVGYMFHPDYFGYKADDHFTMESERDGVIIRARHLLFAHLHPDYGLSKLDDIYRRQKSRAEAGRRAFNRHWGAGSYQDFIRQRDSSFVIRHKGGTARPVVNPKTQSSEASSVRCPSCGSSAVSLNGSQARCCSCSVIFPASASIDTARRMIPAGRDPHSLQVEDLRIQVAALTERLGQLEREVETIRSGGSAKGEQNGWSESALRN